MPVMLGLNSEQMEVFNKACKDKKLSVKVVGRNVTVTRDNYSEICEALKTLHHKKLAIKSKTVLHLEACYILESLIRRLNSLQTELGPMQEANDNPAEETPEETETGTAEGEEETPEEEPENNEADDDGNE